MKRNLRILLVTLALINPRAYGDLAGSVVNNVQQTEGAPSSLSDGQVNGQDRKDNANTAADKGQSGQNGAMMAGTMLMAAGVPMLASIIPSVRAAGAALIAKAALEFAQAGADGKSKGSNKDQANKLSNNSGDTGNQIDGNMPTADNVLTPDQKDYLSKQGIDPNQFGQNLANGNLGNTDAVMQALGQDPSSISPEDKAQGEAQADQQLNTVLAQANDAASNKNGSEPLQGLNFNEGAPASAAADSAGGSGGGAGGGSNFRSSGGGGSDAGFFASNGGSDANGQAHGGRGSYQDGAGNGTDSASSGSGSAAAAANSFLSGLASSFGNPDLNDAEKRALAKNVLGGLGVQLPMKGQNIFQHAHAKYREFAKWRKNTRVAAR